jgi:NADH:ubiquinone reductase (H+-translocating)
MKTRIVVLGAGYAGVLTAKKLEKKLKKQKDVKITIIDKNPFHTMLTELHEVAAGRVEEESIRINLKRVFAGRDVNVVTDNITTVDYDNKLISGEVGKYEYDYLVLATGSKPTFYGLTDLEPHLFTLWSYEDAIKIHEHTLDMFRKASKEPNEEKRKELLSFYIVGAGLTGVEMAGELAEYVPILCKKFEIKESDVKIHIVDAVDRPVPIFPKKLSQKTLARLEKMNVIPILEAKITGAGEGYLEYYKDGVHVKAATKTFIWTAGIQASDLSSSSEPLGVARGGRIETDEYLRSKNYSNVYVAGDNIFYTPEGETSPVPQMVENCEASAKTIANNLAADIKKTDKQEKYAPKFHGAMLCIGGRYGLAYVGTHTKKFALPSFFAMFAKHLINMVYFSHVLGWNKIASYLKHEIFRIKNKRSFVGGHFANTTPSFLTVPLRVLLGATWIFISIEKIQGGWLNTPQLASFVASADAFYEYLLYGVADTVAGATEIVIETVNNPVWIDFDIFGLVRIILVDGGELAFKIQIPMMDTMLNTFVMPYDNMQIMFQVAVVFTQIAVGLGLVFGLFTSLSALVSLALQVSFLTSTGLYMSTWWMFFGGIVFLFGGGSTFGLDYYVMPVIKGYWNKLGFVKKWYIYHD